MNPFAELIKVIGVEHDRRQYDRNMARLGRRIRDGGKRHRQDIAGLAGELEVMSKAMAVDLVETRAAQRRSAAEHLDRINRRAAEMAASGALSGEQGAILDGLLHLAAMRVAAI